MWQSLLMAIVEQGNRRGFYTLFVDPETYRTLISEYKATEEKINGNVVLFGTEIEIIRGEREMVLKMGKK